MARQKTPLYARALLLVVLLACRAAPVRADKAATDAGADASTHHPDESDDGENDDEDAGIAPDTPPAAPTAPAITLPPAAPAPEIAPIVVDRHEVAAQPKTPIESSDRPRALIETIITVLSLMALAYMGGHKRVVELERKLGISQVITAGFPFVLLGLLTRHPSVGLLDDQLLGDLSPLLRIGLGSLGFRAGFRFSTELSSGTSYARIAAYAAGIPFVIVAALCGAALLWTTGDVSASALIDPVFLRDAIILGTAGAMTATSSAQVFRADDRAGALGQVLKLEELGGIIGLAIVAAYFRPRHEVTWQLPGTAWLLLTIGLGATLGLIALLVMRRAKEAPELVVLTLGMIAFSSGTAGYLRLSPIVLAFIAGTLLALLPMLHRRWIAEALRRLERPIYLLSLVVIGALWQVDDWRSWLLVPVFTIARLAGKRLGVELGLRHTALDLSTEQKQALSIAPMGPLAIAIVVNAQLLYPGGSISPIVAAVIVGAIVTEVIVQLVSRRAASASAKELRS